MHIAKVSEVCWSRSSIKKDDQKKNLGYVLPTWARRDLWEFPDILVTFQQMLWLNKVRKSQSGAWILLKNVIALQTAIFPHTSTIGGFRKPKRRSTLNHKAQNAVVHYSSYTNRGCRLSILTQRWFFFSISTYSGSGDKIWNTSECRWPSFCSETWLFIPVQPETKASHLFGEQALLHDIYSFFDSVTSSSLGDLYVRKDRGGNCFKLHT